MVLTQRLRSSGFFVELGYRGNISRSLKRANTLNASVSVILGPDEIRRGSVTVRNLDTGHQEEVAFDSLSDYLTDFL